MKESQAWRECAEWVMAGNPRRRQYLCHRLEDAVWGVEELSCDHVPRHWPVRGMSQRISRHCDEDTDENMTGHALNGQHNGIRATFCLFMALECEDAGK